MNNIGLGIQLMGYGLAGVFTILVVFYFLIRLLVAVFPYKDDNEQNS